MRDCRSKGDMAPLTLNELAGKISHTGGPIIGRASVNAPMAGPGFSANICDIEVDKDTGVSRVVRYTAIQDVGKAVHPSFVEGQMQGGAAQGIGWALNEEYIYNAEGRHAERRVPRLPHAGRLGSADDRHGHRRGRQSAASVRRARRGRGRHRSAARGGGQRGARRDGDPVHASCRCRRRACSKHSDTTDSRGAPPHTPARSLAGPRHPGASTTRRVGVRARVRAAVLRHRQQNARNEPHNGLRSRELVATIYFSSGLSRYTDGVESLAIDAPGSAS